MVAIELITYFVALVSGPISDSVGRRYSITGWNIVYVVGNIVAISSTYAWYQVAIGRLVGGFGIGALSVLTPMYQAETAPKQVRGALISAYQLFITLGIFLAACFNYGTVTHQGDNSASWRVVVGLGWLWTLILGFGMLLFRETPRYDYRRGRIEEARKTLMSVYGAPANHYAIHIQMEEIGSKLRAESQLQTSPIQELADMLLS